MCQEVSRSLWGACGIRGLQRRFKCAQENFRESQGKPGSLMGVLARYRRFRSATRSRKGIRGGLQGVPRSLGHIAGGDRDLRVALRGRSGV